MDAGRRPPPLHCTTGTAAMAIDDFGGVQSIKVGGGSQLGLNHGCCGVLSLRGEVLKRRLPLCESNSDSGRRHSLRGRERV